MGSASPREEEKLILIMVRLNLTGSPVSEQQRELLTKRNKITASKKKKFHELYKVENIRIVYQLFLNLSHYERYQLSISSDYSYSIKHQ